MDDNDVCPLCCEELDISDRQFFPCKCGYQVCMWCWHRIRESESGLCPACRTPYGDDPHEFSAVDMEEVVKANKEKAAAEKREKERLRQQQAAAAGVSGAYGVAGMHIGGGSDGDLAVATAGGSRGYLDPPKDRNQLANMRVIRRNLVYAVGLPPSIATEEILKGPDYFGQNGKISKIVLNRNHNGNTDPRRASASAYVTFAHKEDALSCILALDGFYVDGRNLRASYGTSKYCSAFIKNVRCNNPDCTYLHRMGDGEDTFTKQEIQAGYVTSGRDVLARQQQLAAASGGSGSRRRVGMGGPSGTGKVSTNPVFPPPTYEEPAKPSQSSLVPPPPPATSSTTQFPPVSSSMNRSITSSGMTGFSSVAAGNGLSSIGPVSKMSRSSSLPTSSSLSSSTPKEEPALTPAEMLSRQQEELRKRHPQNSTNTNSKKAPASAVPTEHVSSSQPSAPERAPPAPPSTTAASIVAGVHSTSKPSTSQPAPHTTLTALTPLKRAPSLHEKKEPSIQSKSISTDSSLLGSQNISAPKGLSSSQHAALFDQRKDAFMNGGQPNTSMKLSALRSNSTTLNDSNVSSAFPTKSQIPVSNSALGVGSIGGQVIGGSGVAPVSASIGSFGNLNSSSGLGNFGMLNNRNHQLGSIGSSFHGSEINSVSGQPIGGFGNSSGNSTIGGSSLLSQSLPPGGPEKNMSSLGESKANGHGSGRLFGESDFGSIGGTGLWDQPVQNNNATNNPSGQAGGLNLGGNFLGDLQSGNSNNGNIPRDNVSGSSALASMLGIELPTGVGSLRETLWASSTPLKDPYSEVKTNTPTPIGAGIKKTNVIGGQSNRNIPIGGYEIGAHSNMSSGVPIGGYGSSTISSGGNKNDVAFLQSLLPGVHITSANTHQPVATGNPNSFGNSDWNGLSTSRPVQQPQMMVGGLTPNQRYRDEDAWNKGVNLGYSQAPGPKKEENSRKQNEPNIW